MCTLKDLPYFNVLHAFAPRIVFAMSLKKRCLGKHRGHVWTPSYIFESTLLCLVWSPGKNSSSGAIRLRQGIRLSGGKSSSGNSSSEFVFGKESVFGGQFGFREFVFGIRLRGGIRLQPYTFYPRSFHPQTFHPHIFHIHFMRQTHKAFQSAPFPMKF